MSDTSGVVDLDSIVGSTAVVLLFCDDDHADLSSALAAELPWYEQQSVHVVLVTSGEPVSAGGPVAVTPTVTDASGDLRERYWPGAHAWPATVVIGTDGSMVARVEGGAPEVHLERLREAVAAHVASTGETTTS